MVSLVLVSSCYNLGRFSHFGSLSNVGAMVVDRGQNIYYIGKALGFELGKGL